MFWFWHNIKRFKNQLIYFIILSAIFLCAIAQLRGSIQQAPQSSAQNVQNSQGSSVLFTGTGLNAFYGVNLVPFGPENGDLEVAPGFLTSGQTIDLHLFFPFYGGLYNYTTVLN